MWWNKIPQPEKQQIDIFVLCYFDNDYHFYFIPINLPSWLVLGLKIKRLQEKSKIHYKHYAYAKYWNFETSVKDFIPPTAP